MMQPDDEAVCRFGGLLTAVPDSNIFYPFEMLLVESTQPRIITDCYTGNKDIPNFNMLMLLVKILPFFGSQIFNYYICIY